MTFNGTKDGLSAHTFALKIEPILAYRNVEMTDYLLHWNFDPILFSIGPVHIRYYGLIWAAAFILGQYFINRVYQREQIKNGESDTLFLYAFIGTVAGARLGHCLIYDPVTYLSDPIRILKVWEGGMASHGGAIGLLLALWIYTRQYSMPSYLWLVDRVTIPAALGAALIRFANFLGSDIIGRPTSGTWGVVFDAVDQVPRHPVQLYESAAYLAVFALLITIYRRKGAATPHGLLFGLFLLCVFIARFILEFFKVPQAAYEAEFAITVGQWLSVPFVVMGIGIAIYALRSSHARFQGSRQRAG